MIRLGLTVVCACIGLETARRARTHGAEVILTGRNPGRLQDAALELEALSTAVFDATDPAQVQGFFGELPAPIDHVMVTAGRPHYGRVAHMDFAEARRAFSERLLMMLAVGRSSTQRVRPGGTLLFMGTTSGRRPAWASPSSRAFLQRSQRSLPAWLLNWRRSESTSSPPASSILLCPHLSWAITSTI